MSKPVYKESMQWMKLFVADFVMDTQGLPLSHIGAYIRLMILYWSSNNSLSENLPVVFRKVGAITDDDKAAVADVMRELFPEDDQGVRQHHGLDKQLSDSREVNERKSSGMKRVWEVRKSGATAAPCSKQAADGEDF